MTGGDWVRVPRGAMVRNETTRAEVERKTSYPLQLLRVEDGRAFWLGDRDQLFSTDATEVEALDDYKRGKCPRREAVGERTPYGPRKSIRTPTTERAVRCPHAFLPPLCPRCHGGKVDR